MATTAADVMTSPVIVVQPNSSVGEIANILATNRISAVPVCDADGALRGIVSESDIIRPFRASVQARRDWWIGQMAEGEEMSREFLEYLRVDTRTAADVMATGIITADERASVPQLAELMVNHEIKRVPILRDGRLVGIVSRADLVAAIARAPAMAV
jgi:CBS domain-containing protein